MLEERILLSFPTDEDLPYSDEMPVDNELQLLAPGLLRAILSSLWGDRSDWFFGINIGLYYDTDRPAVGPDALLSLGVPRVRSHGRLRLSYVVVQEQVMPQWVLEVVSQKPGGEYGPKFELYASIGVLYYVIYNPSHAKRDRHEIFEVYKLEDTSDGRKYVRQSGNPVWMPEIGLGIGHEVSVQENIERDWLFWYDEQGQRYPAPAEFVKQAQESVKQLRREREQAWIAQEREQLIRREAEAQRIQAEAQLQQERRSIALKMLQANIPIETVAQITEFSIEQLQALRSEANLMDDLG